MSLLARPAPKPHPYLWQYDRSRYPDAWLLAGPDEAFIQSQVLGQLRVRGFFAFPVDVGAARLRGRVAALLGSRGIHPSLLKGLAGGSEQGTSDVVAVRMLDGRACFIEVKRPEKMARSRHTGRLIQERPATKATPAQLDFLDAAARAGALVTVAWHPVIDLEALWLARP